MTSSNPEPDPLLSLVLCSRNDSHRGNSLWRLQTSLNYLGLQVAALTEGCAGLDWPGPPVEVVVCDWGSPDAMRLADVLAVVPEAAAITRIVEVPLSLAAERQEGSPFAEVVANNTAIRRAMGRYIGRIDQDTLVGRRFLEHFLRRVQTPGPVRPDFLFAGRRRVPFAFTRRSHGLAEVLAFMEVYANLLPREGSCQRPWFDAPVGVVVLHRELWWACRGYDERLLYWGFMETDLGLRLQALGRVVDLRREIGCDFYHLAHGRRGLRLTNRRKNRRVYPRELAPNDPDWGLRNEALEIRRLVFAPTQSGIHAVGSRGVRHFALQLPAEWAWELGLALARLVRGWIRGDRIEEERHDRRRRAKGEWGRAPRKRPPFSDDVPENSIPGDQA